MVSITHGTLRQAWAYLPRCRAVSQQAGLPHSCARARVRAYPYGCSRVLRGCHASYIAAGSMTGADLVAQAKALRGQLGARATFASSCAALGGLCASATEPQAAEAVAEALLRASSVLKARHTAEAPWRAGKQALAAARVMRAVRYDDARDSFKKPDTYSRVSVSGR